MSPAPGSNAYDLLIRDVVLEPEYRPADIGIAAGTIIDIGPDLGVNRADKVLDGEGCLASPPFMDPHAHLDKAFLKPSPNRSGTLEEAISIMASRKDVIRASDFEARVERALHWSLISGTLAVRTHVDVGSRTQTSTIERMLSIREKWRDVLSLQIVAFPQDGLIGDDEAMRFMREAVSLGVDAVGGIPASENADSDRRAHIDRLFELACEFDRDVDMHIDETDDPDSRTLEMLANATLEAGWGGRVAAAHCCALSAYDDGYASAVIDRVAQAGIHIIVNAPVNLALQGRGDGEPKRRGITRVKELLKAGVNVSCGHDNLQDVFYPFGRADMLEVAFVTALAAHMTGETEIQTAFDFPRSHAASLLRCGEYGIRKGAPADLVLIPVRSATEALARKPVRVAVVRRGRVLIRTAVRTKSFLPFSTPRG
jgi:cytosine deaminase